MPWPSNHVPKYRKHRASGQAIVTIAGVDHYLGPHGTRTSKTLYDRLIAEYLSSNRQPQLFVEDVRLTVVELLAEYWKHCKSYYVKNGKPTNEQDALRLIIRDIRDLYANEPAEEFGPKALKAVRQCWIDRGQSRPTINKNMRRLTRIFKWGVSEELIPSTVYEGLRSVPGLKKGRCSVPEPDPILPVEMTAVEQTIPHLPEIVRDMVRIQLRTGMRPGEVCSVCPANVDRSNDVWEYRPTSHKTEHHERTRVIYVGPDAQAILSKYLLREESTACFSPTESLRQYRNAKHAARKTPLSCGNRPGTNRKRVPKKSPRTSYDPNSYRRAIHRACDVAFPPPQPLSKRDGETHKQHISRLSPEQKAALREWQSSHRWSPNQLRHTAATTIRRQFGLEAAQVILGHAAADVTQVYAERDAEKAREVARRIG